MLWIRIALVATMLALPAVACGPAQHDNPAPDDASPGPVYDAVPRPDAGPPPDAEVDAGAQAMRVRAGTVSGGVKASSAHYKLIGTTSEGGSAPSSPSYQLRKGVHVEGQKP